MRARFSMFQAVLGLIASFFGFSAKAQCPNPTFHETLEDCPWAQVTRALEGVSDFDAIQKVMDASIPGFMDQLKFDHKTPHLLSFWGLSRNIDESNLATDRRTAPVNLLSYFNSILKAPYDADFRYGHAGLNHTYGYLFSVMETPYGYKRARYVKHEIEAGFGFPDGIFSGTPKKGTLLLNLTAFAGRIALRDHAVGRNQIESLLKHERKRYPKSIRTFNSGSLQIDRLTETFTLDSDTTTPTTVEMRTDIVPFTHENHHGKNRALLIHSIRIQKKGDPESSPKLITVFPVEKSFGEALFNPTTYGDSVQLKLRYNAALPFTVSPETLIGKRTATHELH